ncbi:MAG TPA: hypothetical protein VGC54_00050 [Planctomycetota bacterium]
MEGRFLLAYHPREALEIEEDWDSLGLRGTASNTIGALRSALDAATRIAEDKTPFAASATLKHRPLAQFQFGRALAR